MNSYGRFERDISTGYVDKYQSDRSSSICPLGDLNNYKSETSISIRSIYICPLGDLNKYTSDTSISMYPTGD